MAEHSEVDILVVGAGVLGVTIAYWLSALYDCRIAVADTALSAGVHASSRNTGVIHSPFYLEPRQKRIFARTSLVSLPLWGSLARTFGLPWRPIGTLNVALDEPEVRTLERYRGWGMENGMDGKELELLEGNEVRAREPEVRCRAALLSRTDVSVDFGTFTRSVLGVLTSRGAMFLGGHRMLSTSRHGGGIEGLFQTAEGRTSVRCSFLINAAGGGALAIAHGFGLAGDYSALNFRGEYWVVDEPFAARVNTNVYRPPRFPQYPFLDPHLVVRADGQRQIGPNAVVVPGPYVYAGIGLTELPGFLERPVEPKARLFVRKDFVSLVAREWRSSLSKRFMCSRVREFVPGLSPRMLNRRAVFGVRSSVVDRSGFIPEAVLLKGEDSAHVFNYNSPGATGAPAYSAAVVDGLRSEGMLRGLKPRNGPPLIPEWEFQAVTDRLVL